MRIDVIPVVTVVKGYNDHQVGDIVKFAVKNCDVISGVGFQPISFVGRFSQSHRMERRYTLADLAFDIERQTGYIKAMRDWFPIHVTSPLSRLATALSGKQKYTLTLHPHCSQGTYFYIGNDGSVKPMSEFLDLKPFLAEVMNLSLTATPSNFGLLSKVSAMYKLKKHFLQDRPCRYPFENFKEPRRVSGQNLRRTNVNNDRNDSATAAAASAGMHFMDGYNFSVRGKRCVIHCPDPRGVYTLLRVQRSACPRRMVGGKFKPRRQLKGRSSPKAQELESVAKKMGL